MATVTTFDSIPPMVSDKETASPDTASSGTCAFTWYRPTNPGAKPEKATGATTPPSSTAGVDRVRDSGLAGDGSPVAGWLLTGPSPAAKIASHSPARAGLALGKRSVGAAS